MSTNNPISNENLLNDNINIKYTDGLKGSIPKSTDNTSNSVVLGDSVTIGLDENAVEGTKLKDGTITRDKLSSDILGDLEQTVAITNVIEQTGVGSLVQQVRDTTATHTTTTTVMPSDDTIPQNTEGAELFSTTITPTDADNILKIDFSATIGVSNLNVTTVALFQDSTADAIHAVSMDGTNTNAKTLMFTYYMTAGTTSSTTFKIRFGPNASGTAAVNGIAAQRILGGAANASIIISEIAV